MPMPMHRETGEDRWKRIPKDYFKKPDGLQKAKLRLTGLAFVLALGWWAAGVDWDGRGRSATDLNSLRADHGELARVHSAWDRKCDACHVPFEPIDGRPRLAPASNSPGRSGDKLCTTCHAGPAHHAAAIGSEVKACAGCHRDHRGREASLVRLDDGECTKCHQALDLHTNRGAKLAGSRAYAPKVSGFDAANHPAFRPEFADITRAGEPVDRGKLKFNHALHMSPGIVRRSGDRPYTRHRSRRNDLGPERLDRPHRRPAPGDRQLREVPRPEPGRGRLVRPDLDRPCRRGLRPLH